MAPPAVIDTSKVVEETLRRIDQGSRRIALVGPPSSGKTTALGQVAERLAADGWSTFRTSMPSGDDAGPLALTLLADQVGCGKVIRDASLFERLDQAARDQLVFPSSVDPARRWDGPHLVHAEGRARVKRWWAGRVETWLDGEVVLRLAEHPGRFGRKTLPASEFRKLLGVPLRRVPAGTFLELVQWPGSKQIFIHPGEVDDVDLPPVLPPADRYLRRAADASLP